MSFLCPTCCIKLFSKKKEQSDNQFAEPEHAEQLDDEDSQMMRSIENQARQLSPEYFVEQSQAANILNTERMNVQLRLGQPQLQQQRKSEASSTKSKNDQNQHSDNDAQNESQQKAKSGPPTQEQLKPSYDKFSINLNPYDKHYGFLTEKTQNIEMYFTQSSKNVDIGQTKCNLKVEKVDAGKFLIRLELPCSYSYYSQLMKDSKLSNKKFMNLFEKSEIVQAFKPNFTKNLIQTKRFNVLEPRQFVYLKYCNGSFKQNWEICISQVEELLQSSANFKRCDFLSFSHFKQIQSKLYIRSYFQIDLKVSNMSNNVWGKLLHEAKEYYTFLFDYIEKNYQNQLL